MPNFGAKILNNASVALQAQQAVIATIGNNIANANTDGYARRQVDLQTRISTAAPGALNIGNGVQVGSLLRIADNFVEGMLRSATATQERTGIEKEFLQRLEGLFTVSGERTTIGSAFTQFFTALNDITTNPSSIELRANFVQRAEDLVTTIKSTFDQIATLQTEADTRLTSEVDNVNSLTAQIAELNGLISSRETSGQTAADERDRRDVLMEKLAEKISYTAIETNDGSLTVTLSNGFAIVNGTTSRNLSLTNSPSFAPGALPKSLGGGILRYVVYDFNPGAGTSHFDLTNSLKDGDGSIAGLLRTRGTTAVTNTSSFQADGILVEMASRVEAITRNLLTSFNQTYLGPDENGGVAGHQSSAGDLNGNVPSVYGLFDFQFSGAKDANADGLPNDLTDPTINLDNYSSVLQMSFTDPRRFAAARDSDAAAGVTSFQPGDGRNAEALVALQNQNFTFAYGSFSLTSTYDEVYNEAITHVGNAKASADLNANVAEANLATAQSRRDELSAVSLDEEFTSLIRFQKAYQASARMIKIADELMQELIGLI